MTEVESLQWEKELEKQRNPWESRSRDKVRITKNQDDLDFTNDIKTKNKRISTLINKTNKEREV